MKWVLVVCAVAGLAVGLHARGPTPSTSPIVVDYPLEGSLFPPDSVAPALQWRDTEPAATAWRIDFTFGGSHTSPTVLVAGREDEARGARHEPGRLRAADSLTRATSGAQLEARSEGVGGNQETFGKGPRHRNLYRLGQRERRRAAQGQVKIQTSTDPVGAPIFYRDVPLIPTPPDQGEREVIKLLPDSVLPKIKWLLRYISGTENKS